MREVDIGYNSITGTLPDTWSNMMQASTTTIECACTEVYTCSNVCLPELDYCRLGQSCIVAHCATMGVVSCFAVHSALGSLAYVLLHACKSAPAFHSSLLTVLYTPPAISWYCTILVAASKSFERMICLVLIMLCPQTVPVQGAGLMLICSWSHAT